MDPKKRTGRYRQREFFTDEDLQSHESAFMLHYQAAELFGTEDAADEHLSVLKRYSIDRDDCAVFGDASKPFVALNAPKGTGKTTLARLTEDRLSGQPGTITIFRYDSDISPSYPKGSLPDWIRAWKRNICTTIIAEYASREVLALDPDLINAIEYAERGGSKKQNLIGFLKDRITVKGFSVSPRTDPLDGPQLKPILERISKRRGEAIWLFIDEVDQNFSLDLDSVHKVAGMLIAARELTRSIAELRIRATIKPNVLSFLQYNIDSMANFRQCIVNLGWDPLLTRRMLARRIHQHALEHSNGVFPTDLFYGENSPAQEQWLIDQMFLRKDFDLGKKSRSPSIILTTLGFKRARWILDLCRKSSRHFDTPTRRLISIDHVNAALTDFGNERIQDLCSEYNSTCSNLRGVIHAFEHAPSSFGSIRKLEQFVADKIPRHKDLKVLGSNDVTPREIIRLLHYIGFIDAKKLIGKHYVIRRFDDAPDLTRLEAEGEDNHFWEIHPAFRRALFCGTVDLNQLIAEKLKRQEWKKDSHGAKSQHGDKTFLPRKNKFKRRR